MEVQGRNIFETGQILLFDKPKYWTSFDLVNKVRIMIKSATGIRKIKVGHAGTLDPLASGLMIICTGQATKKINEFSGLDKEYTATLYAGKTTPSFDLETETNGEYPTNHITEDLVKESLKEFVGAQMQVPPLHSAKMVRGKRAYEYARKGVEMELEPVSVFFHDIELLSFNLPEIKIRVVCSKGTYMRSFARDLGIRLNSGCYLSDLIRTAVGTYTLSNAYSLEKFEFYLEQMKHN